MDDDDWAYYGAPLWAGSTHEMRDAEDRTVRSRLWDLKSTSKAACRAYDKQAREPKARKIGFLARRPR